MLDCTPSIKRYLPREKRVIRPRKTRAAAQGFAR